ncbi:3-oxoacyl-ACP reductase FabG [Spiractinospora alimapuensis]|uniref:3-oxoacyl-ACP reductase FabG n=1 Tax=Spiractinospora alimapuensis TaxID=2820884 RepID=UPI001F251016|nr:3-oxoacyl-ACP reductase FabG [Spiractinospora alimapuensis]QVQ52689.1 3-oxoacyl-ACP reductase FabG [Spiractinospora alimapuensis]
MGARTAIVTGAAQGIGAASALRLAREGCAVAVVDLDEARCATTVEAIRQAGGRAVAIGADVAEEDQVTAAVERTARELGPPTIVVNNAGFSRDANLGAMTTQQWREVMGVHLDAAFFTCRAARPHMVADGWGRIVNISSISALGHPGRVNYSAAKAGILGLTRSLAAELAPLGITANAVAPGFVVTGMTEGTARRLGRDFAEHQRIAVESIPVGRVGQPEDIAHVVAFFASPDAGYVTGQVIYASGGAEG